MATLTDMTRVFIEGAIRGYSYKLAPFASFSYVVDTEATLDDTVRVPFSQASKSLTFSTSTGYGMTSTGAVTGKPVVLDTINFQNITLSDTEWVKVSPQVLTQLGQVTGEQLAGDVISASFAANMATFTNASTYTAGQFTASIALADLDKKANDLHWPDSPRYFLMNPTIKQNLLLNQGIASAWAFGEPVAVEGQFRSKVFGFTPHVVTTTLGGKAGFACIPSAMCHGFGVHTPASTNTLTEFMVATDPVTGLVVSFKSWYNEDKASTVRILEALWGDGVGNVNAGITVAS